MSSADTPHRSPLFHLTWILGLVPLVVIGLDLAGVGSDLVGDYGPWLFAFPVLAVIAGLVWRAGRSTRDLVVALVPAGISLLVLLTLLGFAG